MIEKNEEYNAEMQIVKLTDEIKRHLTNAALQADMAYGGLDERTLAIWHAYNLIVSKE